MSDDVQAPDELTTLKARADLMRLSYHPSIGVEKLREKVAAALSDQPVKEDLPVAAAVPAASPVVETENMRLRRLKQEAHALVRIRVTCMNPNKKDWEGEIITVGNSLVGTVSKFVPFNVEDGWHVPRILYEVLLARQCQVFYPVKTMHGVTVRKGKLIKEFAIEVLPQLTPEELRDLAQRQAMANAID
jgi:hypothetical protein